MMARLWPFFAGMIASSAAFAQVPPAPAPTQSAAAAAPAPGKITQVEIERKGRATAEIFLGTYLALDRDCKIGADPKLEITTEPKGGKIRTRPHPVNLRDVPGAPKRSCIGTSPRGVAVIYRAERKFKGEDRAVFRILYPNGDSREVSAKILAE